jgi:DNA-binding transcriptional regulator WhiA
LRLISREVIIDPSETTRRLRTENILAKITIAYLQCILGDATYNKIHRTHRISQVNREWLERIKELSLDFDPLRLQTDAEKIAYIRGYFDAEGGTAHDERVRFYLQFAEKNKDRLERVKKLLEGLGIDCGRVHCPSQKIDPNYWRFYVKTNSYDKFIKNIGSWHPRKQKIFSNRMKI